MGPTFFLSGPNFSAELAGKSCRFIDTIFRIAVIDTFSRMDGNCIASSVKLLYLGILYRFFRCRKKFLGVFSIASSVKKILANKIVALYLIFFSKIVNLYCFNRYIFEYRCPPLPARHWLLWFFNGQWCAMFFTIPFYLRWQIRT